MTMDLLLFISISIGIRGCFGVLLETSMSVMLLGRLVQYFLRSLPPNQSKIELLEVEFLLALVKPWIVIAKPRLVEKIYLI